MEHKNIKVLVLDSETDEFIEMIISQEALDAMDEADRKCEKRIEEAIKRDDELWQYSDY